MLKMLYFFTVDASNTSSPPQASSTVETPISPSSTQFVAKNQAMTSSDKIMVSSPLDTGGSQFRSSHQTTQQNSNSSVHHNTTNIINNNNNNSQNTENHNNDALRKTSRYQENQGEDSSVKTHLVTPDNEHMLSKKSPSHESHFSGGSGVLVDTPPSRPARRQYVNKSKYTLYLKVFIKNPYYTRGFVMYKFSHFNELTVGISSLFDSLQCCETFLYLLSKRSQPKSIK